MIAETVSEKTFPTPTEEACNRSPTLVGQGLHILNPDFAAAVKRREAEFLCSKAGMEIAAGAEALAINLGPGRDMAELTPWIVETIACSVDVPLFLSAGVMAADTVLEKFGPRIVINAVTADTDTLTKHFKTARQYKTGLVVLLVRPGLVPAGLDERLQIASEVIGRALEIGLPLDRLYIDPVITCRPDPLAWEISRGLPDIAPVLDTIRLIKEMQHGIKTVAALGNGTIGQSREKRSGLHCRMLPLLAAAGADAVILNCLDRSLMQTAGQLKRDPFSQTWDASHHILH